MLVDYKSKQSKKRKQKISGHYTHCCLVEHFFFIAHNILMWHVGEATVNLFDHLVDRELVCSKKYQKCP